MSGLSPGQRAPEIDAVASDGQRFVHPETSDGAPFPIVPDADLKISRSFAVLWPVVHVARRTTFVVRPNMIIDAVFQHEVQISRHRDDVLRHVNAMFKRSRGHDRSAGSKEP